LQRLVLSVDCLLTPSPGSDVSQDGERIVELWRAGGLAQYCKPHLAQASTLYTGGLVGLVTQH